MRPGPRAWMVGSLGSMRRGARAINVILSFFFLNYLLLIRGPMPRELRTARAERGRIPFIVTDERGSRSDCVLSTYSLGMKDNLTEKSSSYT
jgi:hypothetical protein